MRIITLGPLALFIFLLPLQAAEMVDSIEDIDSWMKRISEMIYDWELIERVMTYTHETIPGIGQPSNEITGWFQQVNTEDFFEEYPLLIRNTYTYAGITACEEYYYLSGGELVYCSSTWDNGYGEECTYSDVFYFLDGEPVLFIEKNEESVGIMDTELLNMAERRKVRSESLLWMFDELFVPEPCIFQEKL